MPARPATVLVVDDDPLKRAMLSMSLGAEGHQVREAVAVLAEEAIDIVLTDIEMPEMDGYGLLRHRSGDDRLKTIPFIVISGGVGCGADGDRDAGAHGGPVAAVAPARP